MWVRFPPGALRNRRVSMEIKLSVSIGATLQVKNAKGEWDWIKPEVGAEVKLLEGDLVDKITLPENEEVDSNMQLQMIFTNMWDEVVGPQFRSVVSELISDQTPKDTLDEDEDEFEQNGILNTHIDATEITVGDEDEY